jgi:hypothetical protein
MLTSRPNEACVPRRLAGSVRGREARPQTKRVARVRARAVQSRRHPNLLIVATISRIIMLIGPKGMSGTHPRALTTTVMLLDGACAVRLQDPGLEAAVEATFPTIPV